MRAKSGFAIAALILFVAVDLHAASEIVVAIRYLQAEGTSHSHLYLYRDDGKFLRQLTNDNSGQDVDPVFSADGATIVFTREKPDNSPLEFWSVQPLGTDLRKLDSVPDWYEQAKTSLYFTNRDAAPATECTVAFDIYELGGIDWREEKLQSARWFDGIDFALRSE